MWLLFKLACDAVGLTLTGDFLVLYFPEKSMDCTVSGKYP